MEKKERMLSMEEMRIRMKISKRKAVWMLQNQIIPCQIKNTKTHKYLVREADVEAYLSRPPNERAKDFPVGMFNSKQPFVKCTTGMAPADSTLHLIPLDASEKKLFIKYLQTKLSKYPDAMSGKEVSEFIGYHHNMINRHVHRGDLYGVLYNNQYIIPKSKFIEFLASDAMFRITNKSEIHRDLVLNFRKEIEKE